MAGLLNTMTEDVVLDDEAFLTAVKKFADLSDEFLKLKNQVSEMIEKIEEGFQTPAGQAFMKACKNELLTPMERQGKIIQHISETLTETGRMYQPVFEQYEKMQNSLKQAKGK